MNGPRVPLPGRRGQLAALAGVLGRALVPAQQRRRQHQARRRARSRDRRQRRAADLRRQPAQRAVLAGLLHGLQVRARRRALRADLRRLLPGGAERRHLPLRLRRRRAHAGLVAAGDGARVQPRELLDRQLGRRLLPVGVRRRRDLDRGQPDAHLRRGQALHGPADGDLRRRRDGHEHRRRRRAGAGRRGPRRSRRPRSPRAILALDGTYKRPVTVALSATDHAGGSGVERTEYRINGGSFQRYTAPITRTQPGDYVIQYRSRDRTGNVEATKTRDVHDRRPRELPDEPRRRVRRPDPRPEVGDPARRRDGPQLRGRAAEAPRPRRRHDRRHGLGAERAAPEGADRPVGGPDQARRHDAHR